MIDYDRVMVMADAGRLQSLQRELGWAMSASCNAHQFGTPEQAAKADAKEAAIRARIRAAREYLRSDRYQDDLARDNDWIAS